MMFPLTYTYSADSTLQHLQFLRVTALLIHERVNRSMYFSLIEAPLYCFKLFETSVTFEMRVSA